MQILVHICKTNSVCDVWAELMKIISRFVEAQECFGVLEQAGCSLS